MMMTGGVQITSPMASRILTRVRRRKHLDATVVAKALERSIAPKEMMAKLPRIEFKRFDEVDLTNWGDVYGYVNEKGRKKKGIAHQIVQQGEFGGRVASDLYDAIRNGSLSSSARVGKFKITENSPNTARITVGPDQRQRRKKYVWERVGVQRSAATLGIGAALFAGGKATEIITRKGQGAGFKAGLKNIFKGSTNKVHRAFDPSIKPFTPEPFVPESVKTAKANAKIRAIARNEKKFPMGYITERVPHPADPNKMVTVKKPAPVPQHVVEAFQKSGQLKHEDAGKNVNHKYKNKKGGVGPSPIVSITPHIGNG